MHGVISLLDEDHYRMVEQIWTMLSKDFNVRGSYVTPFPHFSYHIAEEYDLDTLTPTLEALGRRLEPFRVRMAGLGVFTGACPVLYIPVVRTPELSGLHEELWHEVSKSASGITGHYHPDRWVPHVTLAHGDLRPEQLPEIVRRLGAQAFTDEVLIDNLSLIYDAGEGQQLSRRFSLGTGDETNRGAKG